MITNYSKAVQGLPVPLPVPYIRQVESFGQSQNVTSQTMQEFKF